jgi:hypothetical protein
LKSNVARAPVRRVITLLLVIILVGVIDAAMQTTPAAANFGSTICSGDPRTCVNIADNPYHTWYPEGAFGNQIPGMDVSFQRSMDDYEFYTPLDMVKTQSASLDVLVTDYYYPTIGLLGWVECLPDSDTSGIHPYRRCDRQKLRLNSRYVATYFNTDARRRRMACHEIGHTVGLRHRNSSTQRGCMEDPFDPNDFVPLTTTHDDDHLNGYYGTPG